MSASPVSPEVAAAFARYFHGGSGPSHSKLTTAFMRGGYGDSSPYDDQTKGPNKETRVQRTLMEAVRQPRRAKELVEALLVALRVDGHFDQEWAGFDADNLRTLQRAFSRVGWTLSDDGMLAPLSGIDLSTGGRDALDEQLRRLRQNTEDPGSLLGTAKDLLEAVAKFVLEELSMAVGNSASFDHIWYMARERLGLLPQQVESTIPGAVSIQKVLQSSWSIAEAVNVLRGLQGAGHGRTLPTGVSPELALLVVREACSVAEFMLTTLDRQMGRSTRS